jgi:hypothetical protein
MARCEVCGNEYDKSFEVSRGGETHVFDSFECAIQAMAPTCEHCDCRIIGHGVEADGRIFCCAHCASEGGVEALADRASRYVLNLRRRVTLPGSRPGWRLGIR